MSILYIAEHEQCSNHRDKDKAQIKLFDLKEKQDWDVTMTNNYIAFVTDGALTFSLGKHIRQRLTKGKIILLPANTNFKGIAETNTTMILMNVQTEKFVCFNFSLESLMTEKINLDKDNENLKTLEMNEVMKDYAHTLTRYIEDGLSCYYFFDIKIKELFYILRGYYNKETLYNFFSPILSNDIVFSNFVQKNYSRVKTVQELANLANYSLSGFVKRFKKVYGTSVSQWMNEQKANQIYQEIKTKNKTLKEISFEHGFSSPTHFNNFCKMHFGSTPGKLRKNSQE